MGNNGIVLLGGELCEMTG